MSTDVKKRIIQNCSELFYKYGIKSISVYDISFNVAYQKHFMNILKPKMM